MMTVHEVSELTGVSIRALHHYDRIGLLHPAEVTGAGYRLYDDTALERLQCILLFKELQFSLKEIKDILDSPDFDYSRALDQQITLLQMKKEHLENLINLAREIKQMDEYAERAKESWGQTPEYREFEEKSKDRTKEDERKLWAGLMEIFTEFGSMKGSSPSGSAAQRLVKKLQDYITEHFYTCSDEILTVLGSMYDGGGEMTENIDHAGGEGTAEFAAQAIKVYCSIL